MRWIILAIVILGCSYFLPGIQVAGFWPVLLAVIVLSLVNLIVRPLVILLTLPVNILTLGLFTLVINALMIMLVSAIVSGFAVSGFWTALLLGLIISVVKSLMATKKNQ